MADGDVRVSTADLIEYVALGGDAQLLATFRNTFSRARPVDRPDAQRVPPVPG